MRRAFVVIGTLLFAGGATSGATAAAPRQAFVTIVHGLPGFSADIYLDGRLLLDGFEPSQTAGPLRVSPGRHDVAIREIGSAADSPPALSATLRLRPGSDTSIVAHLTAEGNPTLTVFDNAFERLPAGRSLLQIRNLGGGQPLAIRLDGRPLKRSLSFGGERGIKAAPGRHRISFRSMSDEVLVSPAEVDLEEGTAEVVYVVGSSGTGGLELLVQSIPGLGSAPSGVLTGGGGLARETGFPLWAVAVMLLAGVTLIVCLDQLVKERA